MATTNVMEDEVIDNVHFDRAADAVCNHFDDMLKLNGQHLFVATMDLGTKVEEAGTNAQREVKRTLFDVYLDSFKGTDRQHHTCSACRGFINKFGRLVTVNDDGTLKSAMWHADSAPAHYRDAFAAMDKAVTKGKITAVFFHDQDTWGTPVTGGDVYGDEKEWHHFAVVPPRAMIHRSKAETAGQRRALSVQNFITLQRALSEFKVDTVKAAINLLQTDNLYRGEKTMGPATFLLECHEEIDRVAGKYKQVDNKNFPSARNIMWRQVAKAAPGFCTPRSSMIGTLLEDIKAGMAIGSITRRFADKMHPLKYQRPTAAPSTGTIEQAEKLVATLGIERSLERRFARLEEVQTIWMPKALPEEAKRGGVFGHLKSKEEQPVRRDPLLNKATTITWEKFARTVLPNALKIEVYLEAKMAFCGVTTATNADAPPILQWDSEEERNPFSWYFYHGGATPNQFRLTAYTWAEVTGIMLKPSMWSGKFPHHGTGAVLILDGARDRVNSGTGLGLFPETMKSELHSVRSVIEAYSAKGRLSGEDEASANGLGIGERNNGHQIKVTSTLGQTVYTIDRWD